MRLSTSIIILVIIQNQMVAQKDSRIAINVFYTAVSNYATYSSSGELYNYWEHYININSQLSFREHWRFGAEFNLANVNAEGVDNPFFFTGLTIDYDLLSSKKFNLFLRTGLSIGNLSFAGDEEPTKRTVFNRVLGISFSYNIYKFLFINTGLYNHSPLNNIEYAYSLSEPFIGLGVRL